MEENPGNTKLLEYLFLVISDQSGNSQLNAGLPQGWAHQGVVNEPEHVINIGCIGQVTISVGYVSIQVRQVEICAETAAN